jgi:iron complex outermembrane receptor protein
LWRHKQQKSYWRLVFSFFVFHFSLITFAQKQVSLCEVTVKAIRPERFMVGQKVQEMDSANLARFGFATLSDFLQFNAPVAFKSYGAGQLTTISLRGTSASHTAVLWNGININFPSLAQTDFSTVPLAGFDLMTIQYGSAASCVGTDAVGGSIQLRSVPQFQQKGLQALAALRLESSENYTGQVGFRFNQRLGKNWQLSSKTLLYGSIFNNNFGRESQSNAKGQTYNFEPSRTNQRGIVQDVFWQHKNGNLYSLNIWFTDNNVVVQPNQLPLREIIRSQAYRTMASYQIGKTLVRTAFVRDITDYGKGENTNPSHTEIDRFIGRIEHDFSWIKNCERGTNLKIGAEIVHFNGRVDGYGGGLKQENRLDLYVLLRHQFSTNLSTSLNVRQAFVTGYDPPFTPSLGVEYVAIRSAKSQLTVLGNASISYRVPTLNERYWLNLGNPDIRPESGFNKEIGLTLRHKHSEQTQIKVSITAFHNLIDNWTYWNPNTGYRVENLQQVLAKGLEIDLGVKSLIDKYLLSADLRYALTNSSQQKLFGPYTADIVGKQLIYVPRHVVSSTASVSKNNLSLTVQQQFTSERHITFDHSGRPFPPYYLLNVVLNYQIKKPKTQIDIAVQGNNLTNTLYPNVKKNAMPLRTVSLNVVFHF